MTGVDADYWASPIYHSLLQMLTQAFEGVGSFDREAITAHLKKNTYKTIIGEIDVRNQRLNRYWTVGQWQDGYLPCGRRRRLQRLQVGEVENRLGVRSFHPAPPQHRRRIERSRSSVLTWTSLSSGCCLAAPTP